MNIPVDPFSEDDGVGRGDIHTYATRLYVDGNHFFEHVLADLLLGWRKLRAGGLLTGDDLSWPYVANSSQPRDTYPLLAGMGLPVTAALRQFLTVHSPCARVLWTCLDQFFVLEAVLSSCLSPV